MNIQEYLETLINEAKILMDVSQKMKSENSNIFEISNIEDTNAEELFKVSAVVSDTQVAFRKIAEFIYFCKNIELELDISKISDVQGLAEFVTKYIPYDLNTIITEEGKAEVKKENYSEKLKIYRNTVSALVKSQQ